MTKQTIDHFKIPFRILPLGDSCLSVVFEEKIDPAINDRCIQIAQSLDDDDEVREAVPGYHTVAVYFDPLRVERGSLIRRLERRASDPTVLAQPRVEVFSLFEIPVRYGGECGPDLAAVAAIAHAAGAAGDRRVQIEPLFRWDGIWLNHARKPIGDRKVRQALNYATDKQALVDHVLFGQAQVANHMMPKHRYWRADVKPFESATPQPFLFKPGMRVKFVAA